MVYNDEAHKRVFLLSFQDRDGLTAKIKSLNWSVIAARRSDNLLSRFIGAAASIAIIDMRDMPDDAYEEIRELSNFIAANGFALLSAVDVNDNAMIADANKIEATHIISANGSDDYWNANLETALGLLSRLQGNVSSHIMDERHSRTINYSWTFDLETKELEAGSYIQNAINQNLSSSQQSHLKEIYPKTYMLHYMSKYQRRIAIAAYRRLSIGDNQSGFSHNLVDRNFIHHLELDGKTLRGYLEEVSEIKAWRSHDLLTGVRSGSFARSHLLNWKQSVDGGLGLIIVGLRQLELINNRYGRAQGNALIQQAGERICDALSDKDKTDNFVARISGKEFLVAFNGNINIDTLKSVADNIIKSLTQAIDIEGEEYHISARAAICVAQESEDGISALRRVNMTLKEVMKHPNLTIAIANDDQNINPQYNENIERELRSAVDGNQIEVVLQPQFNIGDEKIIGAEALARWNHPTLGKLGADTLFSVADRCDYRDIISQHIQNLALKICADWPSTMADLRLSINVTPQQMSDSDFTNSFIAAIEKTGFNPKQLTMELTEENLIENFELTSKSLLSLREKGIKIAIDDFGTGYSSLAYISELPLDYLKLDQSLIRNITRSNKDLMVLRSIIALGRAVKVKIIAEGVETQDLLELLDREKCDIYQGYYGSKPLSIAQFEKFALRNRT